MSKLWDKGTVLSKEIEKFTVGDDPQLDQNLISYDCLGSIAHASMLYKIGILTFDEFKKLKNCLNKIIDGLGQHELATQKLFPQDCDPNHDSKVFFIKTSDEDVHTAVENYLTQNLGDLGKKIHTARSRNDQVMLDLRLYMRDNLLDLMAELVVLIQSLLSFAEKYQEIPIPGRTHFQKAMPSSFGLWAGAFAESLIDIISLLKNNYELINQSPLGSASAYGVNLDIDRQLVADLLGFSKVQNNVLYASNSRGKFESIVIHGIVQIMADLSKIATDLIVFTAPEFGYVTIPQELCTGSSLMPQKKNPCGLELIRAKSATVIGYLFGVLEIIRPLPSGYNRDFQETKRPLMQSFQIARQSIIIMNLSIEKLIVHPEVCIKAMTPEIFATDYVLQLVKKGVPFRDAYKQVAKQVVCHAVDSISYTDPIENIVSKKHQGATGNLGLDLSYKNLNLLNNWILSEQKRISAIFAKLKDLKK